MKLRKAMMDVLAPVSHSTGKAALLGDIYALDPGSELMRLITAANALAGAGEAPVQIQDCGDLRK